LKIPDNRSVGQSATQSRRENARKTLCERDEPSGSNQISHQYDYEKLSGLGTWNKPHHCCESGKHWSEQHSDEIRRENDPPHSNKVEQIIGVEFGDDWKHRCHRGLGKQLLPRHHHHDKAGEIAKAGDQRPSGRIRRRSRHR
jgi:hypothetical protein